MSNNSGSVEMCLHCLYLETLEVWKCGNVEICLHCLCLITLEVWKCGNMSSLSSSSERFTKNIRGAYHLTENYGNSGWKLNGKVTFRKSQPKIEEYVLTYEPNGMLLTINQFLGSRLTLQKFALFFGFKPGAHHLIQTVTDVSFPTVDWQMAYHYAFDTPTGFFSQMVSTSDRSKTL